jgi:hypothetical protein
MSDLVKVQSAAAPFISRRRGPRVSVPSSVSVRSTSSKGPDVVVIRDLGFRGFAIETREPVAPRTIAQFEISSNGALLFAVEAVAVHCFRQPGANGAFISGWEFDENSRLDEAIEGLINEAVGVITIE